MTHTPGPWTAVYDGNKDGDPGDDIFPFRVDPVGAYDTHLDDARLIAAAPDLLEALEQMAVGIKGQCSCGAWRVSEHQDDPGDRTGPHTPDCVQMVVPAAIAKAKGETS